MTKEQEEAIKMIEIIVDECKLENKRKGYEGTYYDGDTPIPYKEYEIILNMLKAKEIQFQKDINKQEKNRHKQAEKSMKGQIEKKDEELEMYKDIKEIVNSKVTDLLKLKQYDDLKKENRKKDKMIDLMAEHICSSAIVDDTVCTIKCNCETDINEDCTHKKMLNCTKQYFERKATNDG